MEERSKLEQLGCWLDEHAVSDRKGRGIKGGGFAQTDGEVGFRFSGYFCFAVATGCVRRESIRGKPGRQRLCAGRRNGLCALDHYGPGGSQIGHYCG